MPNAITTTGLTTATRAELVAQYTAAYQAIYGSNISLTSDTPDGQMMNIYIQSVLDLEDLLTNIYNMFDPDNAIGVVLDQRVAINGIQRQAGTYTTTNITLVNSQSINLYGLDQGVQPIFTVADNAGNQWQLITTQLGVAAGTHVFAFQAANPGQVLTTPNTITVPVTIVLGVTSVNNPTTYSTLGINEESDAALKVRRQKSVSLQSQGYFQGLLAALENINGITSAYVIENNTPGTDVNGIPGHSIWVVIAGTPNVTLSTPYNAATTYTYGQVASSAGVNYISVANNNLNNLVTNPAFWGLYNPIANAIYNYRNAGCGMYNSGDAGANSYVVTQIDGSSITVYWDTVLSQNLFVKFTANSLNGVNPPSIAAIKTALVASFAPGVYSTVNINQLGSLVQAADSNTMVTSSGFSLSSGGSYTNTLTPTARNNQFSVQAANIIVLPMIISCPSGVQTIASGLVTGTTISIAHGGNTIQFTPLGGYGTFPGTMTFTKTGSGTVNASTGLYTSNAAGTDTVTVTDALGNSATATITVT